MLYTRHLRISISKNIYLLHPSLSLIYNSNSNSRASCAVVFQGLVSPTSLLQKFTCFQSATERKLEKKAAAGACKKAYTCHQNCGPAQRSQQKLFRQQMADLALSATSTTISVVQLLKKQSRDGSSPVELLRLGIDKAWQEVTTLQTNEIRDSGKGKEAIQILTRWCYDAEDLLEKIQLELQDSSFVNSFRRLRRWLGKREDEDEISCMYKLLQSILWGCEQSAEASHQSNTDPGLRNRDIGSLFGRDDDVKKITDKIFSPEKLENNGFSIVGVFGVGKSSLAQKIYNESKNDVAFDRSWVHLPDGKFDWENVEKNLSTSTSNGRNKLLFVIDNLQSVTYGQWQDFQDYMNGHQVKDIRVIVTTRNPKIPTLTNTTLHNLEALQDKYCGDVIKKHANLNPQDSSDIRFQSAVESLQQKCEGLPLVAALYGKVIGSYMRQQDWAKISKAERSSLPPEVKEDILPRFLSSMDKDLPPGFWRRVGYLSLFPRHHHFDIEDFVHLLIGEYFIPFEPRSEKPSSLKEVTEGTANVLLRNAIIAESPEEKKYKMLDVVSHVVSATSSAMYLRLDQDHEQSSKDLKNTPHPRHLSVLYKPELLDELKKLRKLRTFLSLHDKDNIGLLKGILPQLHKVVSSVRVLSLKGTNVQELPASIGKLQHLRYLNISFTRVTTLPKDICSLQALQFLKLEGLVLSCFPLKFHKLTNLLFVDWTVQLLNEQSKIEKIGKLNRLENLPLFKVGRKEGYRISELKNMNNLQGSLCIQDLDEHVNENDAKEANLKEKHGITTIEMEWKENSTGPVNHCDNILEALQFHKHMEEFGLKKYGGQNLPGWITETFLQKIQLSNCKYCTFFPTLGKLKLLKILILVNMDSTDISCRSPDDTEQFPALEKLELQNMSQLKRLSGVQLIDMLYLQEVKIVNCGEMVSVSFLDHIKNFESLTIDGSQMLSELFKHNQRRDHIPRIVIDGEELPF